MVTMQQIRARSIPAVCGITEKEVTVASENFEAYLKALKGAGKFIVGFSPSFRKGKKQRTRKIWFTGGIPL